MIATSLTIDGPSSYRYPRGPGVGVEVGPPQLLEVGKGRIVHPGGPQPDVLVVALGTTLHPAVDAARTLQAEGIRAVVVDPRFVKPLDAELICDLAAQAGRVVTVEEGALQGGFGSAVLEALQDAKLYLPVERIGLPDVFVEHGNSEKQKARFGIDAVGIAAAARKVLGISTLKRGAQAG